MKWKTLYALALVWCSCLAPGATAADVSSAVGTVSLPHKLGTATLADAESPCVVVVWRNHLCSGTAVRTDGKSTLVVTCNHCLAEQLRPGGAFPRGSYPLPCEVRDLDTSNPRKAVAVDGDPDTDLCLVVCDAVLPVVPLARVAPKAGETCWHFGFSSGPSVGRVLLSDDSGRVHPNDSFCSSCTSIPGDSGAGIFTASGLVAVNWGNYRDGREWGTAVRWVSVLIAGSLALRDGFPGLATADCPGGVCPVPQPPLGPGVSPGGQLPPSGPRSGPVRRIIRQLPIIRRFAR